MTGSVEDTTCTNELGTLPWNGAQAIPVLVCFGEVEHGATNNHAE